MRTFACCGPFIAAVTLALFNAGVASASTVEHGGGTNRTLVIHESVSETNTVSITLAGGVFTVTDSSATLLALGGCAQVDVHTATCLQAPDPINIIGWIYVDLGDLDDSATTDVSLETEMHGGAGEDVLTYTGNVVGSLFGEDGNDTLTTGDGEDYLDGGAGNDLLSDGRGSLAHLLGGDGDDVLQGGPTADCLRGGAGVDSLNGGLGRDKLDGDSGNDSLHGDDGRDILKGAGGHDLMLGGSGKDGFEARDQAADRLGGGAGADRAFIDKGLDKKKSIENILSGRQSFPSTRGCF
jgi:Ca2+-binding RTX toxin-like protein